MSCPFFKKNMTFFFLKPLIITTISDSAVVYTHFMKKKKKIDVKIQCGAVQIVSYLLATGAAAGFGVTVDMKTLIELLSTFDFGNFYAKGYASSSLLLLAFFCTAVLSVLSSYALPKSL